MPWQIVNVTSMSNNSKRPKIGLGVYILNEQNELLLLRRNGAHGKGTWCPPGGHLEYGESFEECAKRETKEESGIDIGGIEVVGVTNDIFEEKKHYVTLAIKAKDHTGDPRIMEPEKCDEVGWFPLGRLPSPLFTSVRNYFDTNQECLCGSKNKYKECHGK